MIKRLIDSIVTKYKSVATTVSGYITTALNWVDSKKGYFYYWGALVVLFALSNEGVSREWGIRYLFFGVALIILKKAVEQWRSTKSHKSS